MRVRFCDIGARKQRSRRLERGESEYVVKDILFEVDSWGGNAGADCYGFVIGACKEAFD